MRKQIAAANWKMNLTLKEAEQLIREMKSQHHHLNANQCVIYAVPFPYLLTVSELLKGSVGQYVAAQNLASVNNGAYTGEVSASMLKSMDVKYAIIGHCERREYYHENNNLLAEKVNRAIEHGIAPIFCCGEPLSIRENGSQNSYVELQLKEGLFHLSADQIRNFIVAYEPIWAIGTGKTATSEQAEDMHAHIRSEIATQYGSDVASTVSILYGGSVKPANAAELFSKPNVDGGLVGGASLVAKDFGHIINSLKR